MRSASQRSPQSKPTRTGKHWREAIAFSGDIFFHQGGGRRGDLGYGEGLLESGTSRGLLEAVNQSDSGVQERSLAQIVGASRWCIPF